MAKWRVRYKTPDGTTQTTVELDVSTAKEARLKIIHGDRDLVVAVYALIAVEKVSDGLGLA